MAALFSIFDIGHSVYPVIFSPDGQRLASGSDNNTIKVWDIASGGCFQHIRGAIVTQFSQLPSHQIDSGLHRAQNNIIRRVWDTISRSRLQTLKCCHSSFVLSVDFAPDGQRLASGSENNIIKVLGYGIR